MGDIKEKEGMEGGWTEDWVNSCSPGPTAAICRVSASITERRNVQTMESRRSVRCFKWDATYSFAFMFNMKLKSTLSEQNSKASLFGITLKIGPWLRWRGMSCDIILSAPYATRMMRRGWRGDLSLCSYLQWTVHWRAKSLSRCWDVVNRARCVSAIQNMAAWWLTGRCYGDLSSRKDL